MKFIDPPRTSFSKIDSMRCSSWQSHLTLSMQSETFLSAVSWSTFFKVCFFNFEACWQENKFCLSTLLPYMTWLRYVAISSSNINSRAKTSPSGTSTELMTMIRPGNSNSGRRALLHTWAEAASKMWAKSLTQILSTWMLFWGTYPKGLSSGQFQEAKCATWVPLGLPSQWLPRIQEPSAETWKRMGKFPREDDAKNMNSTPSKPIYPGAQLRGLCIVWTHLWALGSMTFDL